MHNILNSLQQYTKTLPNLISGFSEAMAITPQDRPAWAKKQRKAIFRDGWFINTPVGLSAASETVEDHVQHLKSLISHYLPQTLQEQASLYAEYHDDHEVLAHAVIGGFKRDLNPRFNQASYHLTLEQKAHIESLARAVIFENHPELQSLITDYPGSSEEAAVLFSDLDKLCVMWRCVEFIESGAYSYGDFQAYWDYWTPQNVRNTCSPFIADIYEQDVWSKAVQHS